MYWGEGISTRRSRRITNRLRYWPAYLFICHFTHASRRGFLSPVTYLLNFCYLLSAFHSKSQDDVRGRIVVRPTARTKRAGRYPESLREKRLILSAKPRFLLLPSSSLTALAGTTDAAAIYLLRLVDATLNCHNIVSIVASFNHLCTPTPLPRTLQYLSSFSTAVRLSAGRGGMGVGYSGWLLRGKCARFLTSHFFFGIMLHTF